jgi:tRNA(Ile2) C34 agmatinyltransferase TiaS
MSEKVKTPCPKCGGDMVYCGDCASFTCPKCKYATAIKYR